MFNKVFSKNLPALLLAFLTAGFWLALAHPAAAQSSTLGAVFCNVFTNVKPFGLFFQYAAYVVGCACVVQGIHHFRLHADAPHNNPMNRPIMLWFGAMCLLALPTVVETVILSIYGTPASGGSLSCVGLGSGSGGATTPDVMLTNFMANIKGPLLSLVSLIAIVCGLFMIVHGLMKASKYGFDPKTHSVHSILANIVFGALLLTIGDNLGVMLASVFGTTTLTSSDSVMSWSFLSSFGASTEFENAVIAALGFVQLIGAIAFVRGWLIMKKVVEGGGQVTMAQGITHILGGVFAINIFQVLQIFDNTLGTGLLSGR